MKRRHFILSLGGASAGAMTIGSGAFSSAEMERGVTVSVVEDDSAFVGYDNASDPKGHKHVTDDGPIDLVTVENRFANEVNLSVSKFSVTPESGDYPDIDPDSLKLSGKDESPDDEPVDLGPGESVDLGPSESGTIRGTVVCNGNSERAAVAVTIRVEGGGVSAEVFGDTETRQFDIICAEVTTHSAAGGVHIRGVRFDGKGNAELLSSDDGEVDVRVYYVDGDGVAKTEFKSVKVDEKLKKHPSITDETFAGVEIDGIGGVFVHPQFTNSECDVTPGTGDEDENGVSGGKVTEIEDPDDAFDSCLDGG